MVREFNVQTSLSSGFTNTTPRPPLKKMLFLVQRPGDYITAEWELFFFANFIFFWLKFHHFLQKKKKNCGRPTGHNFGHPLDRKQTFFLRVAPGSYTIIYLVDKSVIIAQRADLSTWIQVGGGGGGGGWGKGGGGMRGQRGGGQRGGGVGGGLIYIS